MSRGYFDYGYPVSQVSASLPDMGELAARLGSRDKINRQGLVLALDTFENGFDGWQKVGGSSVPIVRKLDAVGLGNITFSLLSDNIAINSVEAIKYLSLLSVSKVGFETMMQDEQDFAHTPADLYIKFAANSGAGTGGLYIRLDKHNGFLDIHDDTFPPTFWRHLDTLQGGIGGIYYTYVPTYLKISYDMSTRKGTKLIMNNKTYDISSYGDVLSPGLGIGQIFESITVTNSTFSQYTDFDYIITTMDEP